ncbi:uncharacterized protein [Bactrocera oleae]|uniref:uncharacterized protein isoform X2 n=1 Tax=Bactrocera oleae TaxID=104688 RepID=UPI0006B6E0A4|nr:uncharacterized protein LOC106619318 isoform X2 [Bactrocera oleae]XP_036222009.1 uncharacterized protein LOC106619318 isoform X2 [Bactrocera oleae]
MQSLRCSLGLFLVFIICQTCLAVPALRVKRQPDDLLSLEAESADAINSDLNPINAELTSLKTSRLIRPSRATGNSNNKYDDVPEFDRKQVSLDFPEELFNKSFATVTNISKSFSRLIMNSARRYSRFVLFFKPVFGDALVVKGWEDPTTTTTTPKPKTTTTSANPLDMLNEV